MTTFETLFGDFWGFVLWTVAALIQALQLAASGFGLDFHWPDAALDVLEVPTKLYANFVDDGFYVTFMIASCLLLAFALLPITQLVCDDCLDETDLDEHIWFWFGDAVLFGVLFIPYARLMLEMMSCEQGVVRRIPDLECESAEHIIYVIMAALVLLVLVGGFFMRAPLNDETAHKPENKQRLRASVRFYDSKYQLYRLIVIILVVFLYDHGPVCWAINFALSLVWMVLLVVWRPHLTLKYNLVKAAMYSLVSWVFLCTLIASTGPGEDDDDSNYSAVYLLIGLPFWVGLYVFGVRKYLLAHPPQGADFDEIYMHEMVDGSSEIEKVAKELGLEVPTEGKTEERKLAIAQHLLFCHQHTDDASLRQEFLKVVLRTDGTAHADRSGWEYHKLQQQDAKQAEQSPESKQEESKDGGDQWIRYDPEEGLVLREEEVPDHTFSDVDCVCIRRAGGSDGAVKRKSVAATSYTLRCLNQVVRWCENLRTLVVEGHYFRMKTPPDFQELLQSDTETVISNAGNSRIERLARTLHSHPALRTVDLSDNEITAAEAMLVLHFAVQSQVRVLNFRENDISSTEARRIREFALQHKMKVRF